MEYIIVLALSFFKDPDLKFYNFANVKFNNLETCETFIISKSSVLKDSIQFQFNKESKVKDYAISCWDLEEWNKYLDPLLRV